MNREWCNWADRMLAWSFFLISPSICRGGLACCKCGLGKDKGNGMSWAEGVVEDDKSMFLINYGPNGYPTKAH